MYEPELDSQGISSGDKGLDKQIREDDKRAKKIYKEGRGGSKDADKENCRGDKGGGNEDNKESSDGEEFLHQSSRGENNDKQGSQHSTNEIIKKYKLFTDGDEVDQSKFKALRAKVLRLPKIYRTL